MFALLPLANVAHAQVVVYNHGKRVRVAHTASKTWSNFKTGVTKESRRIGHATTQGWNRMTRGVRNGYNSSSNFGRRIGNATTEGWNGLRHGVSNGYSNTSATTTYQQTYRPAYRTSMRTYTHSTMYRGRMMSQRKRDRLNYRTRLMRERLAREHRLERYHAQMARHR